MSIRFLATTTVALFLAVPAMAEGMAHWTYEGAEGPEFWGEISSDFAVCATGDQQSPVDLTGAISADAADVALHWNPQANWNVVNNGHTIQASSDDGGTITIGGKDYKLLQLHFHTPSEHAIDGQRAPMEVHFVHKAEDGSLAVIGVMMTGGGSNDLFHAVMAAAPAAASPDATAIGAADATGLMPGAMHFFRYEGSLTTPPCAQTVLWTVMKEPVAVADADIAAFEKLYEMNARPLQPLNRRYILAE